jgi:hypothetical protein
VLFLTISLIVGTIFFPKLSKIKKTQNQFSITDQFLNSKDLKVSFDERLKYVIIDDILIEILFNLNVR